MINYNGEILDASQVHFSVENRAFKYGDAVFESVKYAHGKLQFWEDHYFRLMAGMRIIRMEIPMQFSPEFLEEQILETIAANHEEHNANRIRITVFRNDGGQYAPLSNQVSFTITSHPVLDSTYELNEKGLVLGLYKDMFKPTGLLSGIKSANALTCVLAAVYKQENAFDECLLINERKEVVEVISSNIFLIQKGEVVTPPTNTGCLKGVMRKNVISLLKENGFNVREEAFSPFELQRADEVFLTNAIQGLQWVGQYRKKSFENEMVRQINDLLNQRASLK